MTTLMYDAAKNVLFIQIVLQIVIQRALSSAFKCLDVPKQDAKWHVTNFYLFIYFI